MTVDLGVTTRQRTKPRTTTSTQIKQISIVWLRYKRESKHNVKLFYKFYIYTLYEFPSDKKDKD